MLEWKCSNKDSNKMFWSVVTYEKKEYSTVQDV